MKFLPSKKFRLFLLVSLLVFLVLGSVSNAHNVANDVTLLTTAGSFSISIVAGSEFDTLTLPASSDVIQFALSGTQKVTLRSATRRTLVAGAGTFSCTDSYSEFVVSASQATSVGVSVIDKACSAAGGGGGGGGGSVVPTTTTTTTTTTATTAATTPTPTTTTTTTTTPTTTVTPPVAGEVPPVSPAASVAAIERFKAELNPGSRGDTVTDLQLFLALDAEIYPEALVTGYYGPLTTAAVKRFQKKYGISQVGRVGPQTLAVMNAVLDKEKAAAPATPATTPTSDDPARAALQAQIQQVQAQVSSLQAAIQARLAGQVAPVPAPAVSPTPAPSPAPAAEDSTAAQRAAIQKQITEALAKVAEITAQIQAAQ